MYVSVELVGMRKAIRPDLTLDDDALRAQQALSRKFTEAAVAQMRQADIDARPGGGQARRTAVVHLQVGDGDGHVRLTEPVFLARAPQRQVRATTYEGIDVSMAKDDAGRVQELIQTFIIDYLAANRSQARSDK